VCPRMPAQAVVPSLQHLASSTLCNTVLEVFHALHTQEASLSTWAPSLHSLLSLHLQRSLYQELVEEVLLRLDLVMASSPALRPAVRLLVPALLGPQLRRLDFTRLRVVADKAIVRSLYAALPQACPNLQHLTMGQSFFFLPELVSDLDTKLAQMPRLTSLSLHYIATDSILTKLAVHCPNLIQLSLKGSGKVTDECVGDISGCSHLTVLDIQGTQITGNGLLEIIDHCPQLAWVEHCPFNCDSDFKIFKSRQEMLDLIQKGYLELQAQNNRAVNSETPPTDATGVVKTQYNIRNFWLFNPKSEELLISLLCPKLEKMRLDFVFQDMTFALDVAPLSTFKHLHTLDLNFYDNHRNPLLFKILKTCGLRIKTLIYNVFADYRSIVDCHNIIARTCPNLTHLTFIGDYRVEGQEDTETDALLQSRTPDFQPHPRLEELKLGGYCTDGRLVWLLAGAPNIRTISLDGNLEQLGDGAWTRILAENSMDHLQSVWFNTSTKMSMASIHRILECPRVRRVGRLIHLVEHTGGARRDNLTQLLEKARRENWGVEFVWVTPGPILGGTGEGDPPLPHI